MKKKIVWIYQAYEELTPEGQLKDVVLVEVYALNEDEALKKVKYFVSKPNYRLHHVIEKYEKI